jgi:hypothetical protein
VIAAHRGIKPAFVLGVALLGFIDDVDQLVDRVDVRGLE